MYKVHICCLLGSPPKRNRQYLDELQPLISCFSCVHTLCDVTAAPPITLMWLVECNRSDSGLKQKFRTLCVSFLLPSPPSSYPTTQPDRENKPSQLEDERLCGVLLSQRVCPSQASRYAGVQLRSENVPSWLEADCRGTNKFP